jgi:hypothetical protein
MTGIQNAAYAMALSITRRLVGRHYTPSPQVLVLEAETGALNTKTIQKAREVLGHIETLTEMRKRDRTDRDSNLWSLAVNQIESDWHSTGKPNMLNVAPTLRGQAKDVITKTEAAIRALRIASLH